MQGWGRAVAAGFGFGGSSVSWSWGQRSGRWSWGLLAERTDVAGVKSGYRHMDGGLTTVSSEEMEFDG